MEERAFEKWMGVEMTSLARSIVTSARPVGDVLAEDAPVARTRGGDEHRFDKAAVAALAARLSPLERRRVRVPITFWVDKDVPDAAYVQDAAAADALRAAGVVPADREMRDGRLWLGLNLARDAAGAYPTLFQFVYF